MQRQTSPHIEELLKRLPGNPGVYLMKSATGNIIYIGKAKNLKSRVLSYFRQTGDTRYAVKFLASRTSDIDTIVTTTEKEALLLEDTLLKKHKPKYNIQLKDSKTYVSIKITTNEEFPRILVTRQIKKDGARYFGPYISSREVRETIKFLRRLFPMCVCSQANFRNRVRPCLDHSLGLCPAPAVGLIDRAEYMQLVNGAIMFLEGKNREIMRFLKERMRRASVELKYEEAAVIRDRIAVIEEILEEQKVVTHTRADRDVFAIAHDERTSAVQALHVREGRLVGGAAYFYEEAGINDDEIYSSFLNQFYKSDRYVPDEIIVSAKPADAELIEDGLKDTKKRRCKIIQPRQGEKLRLLEMAAANAAESLNKKIKSAEKKTDLAVELQKRLRLKRTPHIIEAFDISNLGSTNAVGAMVVFKDGEPDKGSYRRYRIKDVQGQDDFAMIREMLSRRYRSEGGSGSNPTPLPDLILIDGGKGQLNSALAALADIGIRTGSEVEIISLAKDGALSAKERFVARLRNKEQATKGERVFLPNVKDPVLLKEGSRPDLLLRRIRDEVHRYVIGFHRSLRSRELKSALDAISGIGPALRTRLLKRFGDLGGVLNATVEELVSVRGMTPQIAERLHELKV